MKKAMLTLQNGTRSEESMGGKQRRAHPVLRCPTGMQPLGPGPFGEILDDTGGEATGDAKGIGDLTG